MIPTIAQVIEAGEVDKVKAVALDLANGDYTEATAIVTITLAALTRNAGIDPKRVVENYATTIALFDIHGIEGPRS